MRILVNGYFYGGNCPPFVSALKQVNPDTKLTNALSVLDEHGLNRDYLEPGDLLPLRLNDVEKAVVILGKKARMSLWKTLLARKAAKLVDGFKPDVIINHKASEKAEIMLRTGFKPQLTYVYGGEVHGDRLRRRELDCVFQESAFVLTTTMQMRSHLVAGRPELKGKVRVFPMGYFELDRVREFLRSASRAEIRRKHGFGERETVFFENRSLRGAHAGFDAIITALRGLSRRGLPFRAVFLRGFLGTEAMARRLRTAMAADPALAGRIVFIDEVVPEERVREYYFLADAFLSLLPADQCGKCINDAVFLGPSLILSDLEVYRERLGPGPFYVGHQDPAALETALERVIAGEKFRPAPEAHDRLAAMSRTRARFESLHLFLEEVVARKQNETSIA